MTNTPILITGGTGFAGSHLAEALSAAGEKNIHVTTAKHESPFIEKLLPAGHIHTVDLTKMEEVNQLWAKLRPEKIYHLAALSAVSTSFDRMEHVLRTNQDLQLAVLEATRRHTPKARILSIGSGMVYDVIGAPTTTAIAENHPLGPASPYAVSKLTQEFLALSYVYTYHLDIVRVRPFNHIGERQSRDFAIPNFAHQVALIEAGQQKELSVGNLNAVRDFTDVKDVVQAYRLLMEKGETGAVYNVGSGQGVTVQETLDMLCELASQPIPIHHDAARLRPLDVPALVANSDKMRILGWEPTIPLRETLQRVLQEWRTQITQA